MYTHVCAHSYTSMHIRAHTWTFLYVYIYTQTRVCLPSVSPLALAGCILFFVIFVLSFLPDIFFLLIFISFWKIAYRLQRRAFFRLTIFRKFAYAVPFWRARGRLNDPFGGAPRTPIGVWWARIQATSQWVIEETRDQRCSHHWSGSCWQDHP